jgi:hypothetical protein
MKQGRLGHKTQQGFEWAGTDRHYVQGLAEIRNYTTLGTADMLLGTSLTLNGQLNRMRDTGHTDST